MDSLAERVLLVTAALERADIPYAVGGAIALGFYAEPRATKDIDVNVFLPETEAERVLQVIASLGARFDAEQMQARVRNEGQVRLPWDPVPEIDLFFSTVPFHDSCQERIRRVPFSGDAINILSCEDLAVCKAVFNRPKDWPDIRQMIAMQGASFDAEYVRSWLAEMLGADSEEAQRFNDLLTQGPLP